MKKIILGRGKGKTTELIKLSHDTNAYIIVKDHDRAREVRIMAEKMGLYILFPVTVTEYMLTKLRGSHVRHVLIDDADDILEYFFNSVTIDAITMTKEGDADEAEGHKEH